MLFLCIKIFLVRILDVSLGTIRTIMTIKNKTLLASIIGFIEITVWFLVAKEALNTNNNNLYIVFSYALGFSTGTYIGGLLSNKYIKGYTSVQIITTNNNLENILRKNGYGITTINIENKNQKMLILQIKNKTLDELKKIINKYDPKAFIVINETKYIQNGFIKR